MVEQNKKQKAGDSDETHSHEHDSEGIVVFEGVIICHFYDLKSQIFSPDIAPALLVNERGKTKDKDMKKIKSEVYFDESKHKEPHFHVTFNGETSSHCISNGKILQKGKKTKSEIRKYWKKDRYVLAEVWNATRPGNTSSPNKCKICPSWYPEDGEVAEKIHNRIKGIVEEQQPDWKPTKKQDVCRKTKRKSKGKRR